MRIHFSAFFLLSIIFAEVSLAKPSLAKENCLKEFQELAQGMSYEELTTFAKRLNKRDLKCLYKQAQTLGAPKLSFFTPTNSERDAKEMAIIFGKNSMPFHNRFEKHLFAMDSDDDGPGVIYGYNFHNGMSITGPGFFKAQPFGQSILLDFNGNFEREIPSIELSTIENVKTTVPRNNHFNLFYGGETRDYCHRLLYDEEEERDIAVVCEGYRSFFGIRLPFIWDILIRKW